MGPHCLGCSLCTPLRTHQANRAELARSLSQRERWARTLAQAEAAAGWCEVAEAEAERATVVAEIGRLSTVEGTIASAVREQRKAWQWPQAQANRLQRMAEAEAERAVVAAEIGRLLTVEGTIAGAVREQRKAWLWPSRRCLTALHAAQLRLVLGLLYSERLTEQCPVVLEGGRITEIIVSCWTVRPDSPRPSRV